MSKLTWWLAAGWLAGLLCVGGYFLVGLVRESPEAGRFLMIFFGVLVSIPTTVAAISRLSSREQGVRQ